MATKLFSKLGKIRGSFSSMKTKDKFFYAIPGFAILGAFGGGCAGTSAVIMDIHSGRSRWISSDPFPNNVFFYGAWKIACGVAVGGATGVVAGFTWPFLIPVGAYSLYDNFYGEYKHVRICDY